MENKQIGEAVQSQRDVSPNKKQGIRSLIIWLLIIIVISIGAFYFTRNYVVRWPIKGDSMEPSIHNDDMVLLFKTQKANYDDVIIFYEEQANDNEKYLIKRVIGKSGDVIKTELSTEDNRFHVYRNGELVDESHIKSDMLASGGYRNMTITVPDGYYYVLGDNRNNSRDSHFGVYAKVELVEGIVFARYTSASDFKFL